MLAKLFFIVLLALAIFLGYAATRPAEFRYARTGIIVAPLATVFPYLTHFRLGSLWNPYEAKDPNMTKSYIGPEGVVGSRLEFEGNTSAGAGMVELIKIVPNESVELKLDLSRPVNFTHTIRYSVKEVPTGTELTWTQEGRNGFVGKVMSVVIDCDKMFGTDMEQGILNLKKLVEKT